MKSSYAHVSPPTLKEPFSGGTHKDGFKKPGHVKTFPDTIFSIKADDSSTFQLFT